MGVGFWFFFWQILFVHLASFSLMNNVQLLNHYKHEDSCAVGNNGSNFCSQVRVTCLWTANIPRVGFVKAPFFFQAMSLRHNVPGIHVSSSDQIDIFRCWAWSMPLCMDAFNRNLTKKEEKNTVVSWETIRCFQQWRQKLVFVPPGKLMKHKSEWELERTSNTGGKYRTGPHKTAIRLRGQS